MYIEKGAKVIAAGTSERIHKLKDEFDESVLTTVTDVSNEDDVQAMFNRGIEQFGKINILVNNAGVTGPLRKIHKLSTAHFKKVVDVNLMGTFYGTKHIIPHFLENGEGIIINISSIGAYPKYTAEVGYSASKAAVKRLTQVIAAEYAENNIRANAIAPGLIDTPIYDNLNYDKEYLASLVPVKTFGQPEDIANMAVFLSTDESKYVTGQCFLVDGGYLLT